MATRLSLNEILANQQVTSKVDEQAFIINFESRDILEVRYLATGYVCRHSGSKDCKAEG